MLGLTPADVALHKAQPAARPDQGRAARPIPAILEGTFYPDEGLVLLSSRQDAGARRPDHAPARHQVPHAPAARRRHDPADRREASGNAVLRAAAGYQRLPPHPPARDARRGGGRLPPCSTTPSPASVAVCIERLDGLLTELKSRYSLRGGNSVLEQLDEMRAVLAAKPIETVLAEGLHEYLALAADPAERPGGGARAVVLRPRRGPGAGAERRLTPQARQDRGDSGRGAADEGAADEGRSPAARTGGGRAADVGHRGENGPPGPFLPVRADALPLPVGADRAQAVHPRMTGPDAASLNSILSQAGFRRSHGRGLPAGPARAANACVPVRIPVDRFRPNRSMRRILAANAELENRWNGPPRATPEQYSLFGCPLPAPPPRRKATWRGWARADYAAMVEDGAAAASIWEFPPRRAGRTGRARSRPPCWPTGSTTASSAVLQLLRSPKLERRSPGTFMILGHGGGGAAAGPSLCLSGLLDRRQPGKMAYKARFRPLEALVDGGLAGSRTA